MVMWSCKGSCNIIGKGPSRLSHHPAWFGGNSLWGSEVIMVFVCHVISRDHVTKGDSMSGEPPPR